jgi:hypothetical protein
MPEIWFLKTDIFRQKPDFSRTLENAARYQLKTEISHQYQKPVGAGSPRDLKLTNRLNKPALPHESPRNNFIIDIAF